MVCVVATFAVPTKLPVNVVALKLPVPGLYVNGVVVLSTFKERLPVLLLTKTGGAINLT
jgi:hypothetical protein